MSQQWEPEREIGIDEAAELIRAKCPDVEFDQARIFASGWDNTVVVLDQDWIFRFPRRSIALPGVRREIDWLEWISERIDLPVPIPAHVGDYDGWPFWGGRLLLGEELAHCPHVDRVPIAESVGRFLAQLHAIEPRGELPVDPFARGDSASRSGKARDVLDDLIGLELWESDPDIEAILAEGSQLGPPLGKPVFSHGDLYSRHVLVGPEADAVCGIIDWGDLCMAVPAVDLAIAYSAFSGEARESLLDAYGSIDPETEIRSRTFAIFSAASVAHYAHDVGDEILLDEAIAGLQGAGS
ncbi:MAG: phosphotransferase [Aeromicrobium sp.]